MTSRFQLHIGEKTLHDLIATGLPLETDGEVIAALRATRQASSYVPLTKRERALIKSGLKTLDAKLIRYAGAEPADITRLLEKLEGI